MEGKQLELFMQYLDGLRDNIESIEDVLPEDVKEAHEILIKFGDLIADPTNADKTIQDAIYSKIPQDKLEWALNTLEEWQETIEEDEN